MLSSEKITGMVGNEPGAAGSGRKFVNHWAKLTLGHELPWQITLMVSIFVAGCQLLKNPRHRNDQEKERVTNSLSGGAFQLKPPLP